MDDGVMCTLNQPIIRLRINLHFESANHMLTFTIATALLLSSKQFASPTFAKHPAPFWPPPSSGSASSFSASRDCPTEGSELEGVNLIPSKLTALNSGQSLRIICIASFIDSSLNPDPLKSSSSTYCSPNEFSPSQVSSRCCSAGVAHVLVWCRVCIVCVVLHLFGCVQQLNPPRHSFGAACRPLETSPCSQGGRGWRRPPSCTPS
jgi:hypothetical protein